MDIKFNESFKNILKSILEINKKCNYLFQVVFKQLKKNKNIHEIENLYNRYIKN